MNSQVNSWKIYFIAKEQESNRVLDGDSTTCNYNPTTEQAIEECKDVVAYFNSTLRPYEKPREFVKVSKIVPIEPTPKADQSDDYDDDY